MTDLNIDFEKVISIVKEAALLFGNEAAAEHIKIKGRADFVTEVDTRVQSMICEKLKQLYPTVQFMGEEKDNSEIDFKKPVWILDPVDGTTNLVHHYRASSVSLGLAENNQIVAGIIYNPYADELFFAKKGCGAFLNGEPIHVSGAQDLSSSLIGVGTTPYSHENTDWIFDRIKELFLRSHDIRRIGSAAIDLAYVACGRAEAFLELSLKPWDFAAAKVIIEEAGGRMTDYDGNEISPGLVQGVVGTNGLIHEEIIEILKNHPA